MRSLVLIRDHRRQLPWSSRDAVSDASTSRCSPTALAIDPVHGTGFLLLAREGRLLACDPEAGCVWTADLDAAVAEGAEGEEELAAGADDGTVRSYDRTDGSGIESRGWLPWWPISPTMRFYSLYTHSILRKQHLWLAALHLAEQETVLCVHRSGALVLVDGATGEASLAGVVGPGGVLAAGLAPDEELLVFVTGAGVLLGMTPGLEVLYEVRGVHLSIFGYALGHRSSGSSSIAFLTPSRLILSQNTSLHNRRPSPARSRPAAPPKQAHSSSHHTWPSPGAGTGSTWPCSRPRQQIPQRGPMVLPNRHWSFVSTIGRPG